MLIALDVDGPVASLHQEWIRRYNADFGDTLTSEAVLSWSIHDYVKPECGSRIYEYLCDPAMYDNVAPVEGALEGVKTLRGLGNRVVFVTSASSAQAGPKLHWLERHGFLSLVNGTSKDYVVARDKSLIKCDVIIDDYPLNLEGHQNTILLDAPYNQGYNKHMRVHNWEEIVRAVFVIGAEEQAFKVFQK